MLSKSPHPPQLIVGFVVWLLLAAVTVLRSAAAAGMPPLGPTHGFNIVVLDGAIETQALAINDAGQVAGTLYEQEYRHAALWSSEGVVRDLGALPGNGTDSYAWGINNRGEVAGVAWTTLGQARGFLWLPAPAHGLPAGMNDLGTLGGTMSGAYDVNDRGEVVGGSFPAQGPGHPFLWLPEPAYGLPAGMNDLGPPQGADHATALAINNQGQVVGTAGLPDGTARAILWEDGTPTDLGTLGGANAQAYGVSETGQVVGVADTPDRHPDGRPIAHAFLWTHGGTDGVVSNPEMKDLGTAYPTADSAAMTVNAAGLAVGAVSGAFEGGPHPFLWQNGTSFDLQANNPEPERILLRLATCINDQGQVAGIGTAGGYGRGYRLDPVPAADLSLEHAAPTSGKVGSPLTFTLTARNSGPTSATAVILTDTLPSGAELLSVDTSQGAVTEGEGRVTVDIGTLAAGEVAAVHLTIRPLTHGIATNTAVVSAAEPDPTPASNESVLEVPIEPLEADLSLRFQLIGNSAHVGRPLAYAAVVTNRGPDPATGVRLTDVLPEGVEFVSANASQGTVGEQDGTITAELGTLASGAQASVNLTVTPTATGILANTAAVTSQEEDPTPDDASVTVTVTVLPPPAPDLTGIWEGLRLKSVTRGRGKHRKVTLHLRGKLTVRNVGEAPSGRTRARFFLSRDQILDPADAPFAVPLAAVRALTPSASVAVPRPETPGSAPGFDVKVSRGKNGGSALHGRYLIARIVPLEGETSRTNNTVISEPLP
jgi:uncharacterized repeat protein (TIGR01451 family)